MDTSGNNNIRLTYNDKEDYDPSWSPDGITIAWTSNNGVWLMNADGSNQREFIGNYSSAPSWSPDSKKIVFSKLTPTRDKIVLCVINIEGSGLRQLTN